ncbi:4'-phosphopantetheinyl transferase superfamily protein [Aquimarina gracilis]|uniref:4'-phosphopantetheinyl transferase superfamily protein n=1 Tax=Aquimarina gracilis TaxID=874422 RepID=A0ABU6A0H7_9FLAO|nr:4'-phosphopantetheinyl transferase superfamily protein [Aquimarina gracilis]MEB3347581.1 4'-phosphopantetheinyl transferase superfamily protein [Aquimarina gracilis]
MPLYKTITVDKGTNVLIWKIEETYESLCKGIELTQHCQNRVDNMKSEIHRRGFMSVRHLLGVMGYTDHDLFYDEFGKPHLKDGKHISITHSFEFAGIIISDKEIGIDIEKQREKIQIIAHKFVNKAESNYLEENDLDKIRALTILWGAKESLYKLYATPGLSFEEHIYISAFKLDYPFVFGTINYQDKISHYGLAFIEFEGYTCVYAMPSLNDDFT